MSRFRLFGFRIPTVLIILRCSGIKIQPVVQTHDRLKVCLEQLTAERIVGLPRGLARYAAE
jgi:hypothetical protein